MNELVSILIPVYNREGIIRETLDSALVQTYTNIEIIVVDNASRDGTWGVIQEYAKQDPRVKVFRNESNIGPVRNWKRCVDEACGYYGKILWSDDLIAPDFLEKTLPLFSNDVGFVYSGVKIFFDKPVNGKKNYFIGKTGGYSTKTFIDFSLYDNGVPFSPGCAVFRLKDLEKNLLVDVPNKVDSDFSMHAIGNDLLIFLLTSLSYKKFGFVSESLSFFRAHEGSISVASESGKLPLHYALAKSYFVDGFYTKERACLSSFIRVLLWENSDSTVYRINHISDFFNSPIQYNKRCLVLSILKALFRLVKRLIKQFCIK